MWQPRQGSANPGPSSPSIFFAMADAWAVPIHGVKTSGAIMPSWQRPHLAAWALAVTGGASVGPVTVMTPSQPSA